MAIVFLLLGVFLFYQAMQLSMTSLDGGPGPGLLPAGLGLLLAGLAARLVPVDIRERPRFGHAERIAIMIGTVGLYTIVLEAIGFVIATSLLMVALLLTFNDRYRPLLAVLGVAGTVLTYALFANVLKVQLPPDPWGIWR